MPGLSPAAAKVDGTAMHDRERYEVRSFPDSRISTVDVGVLGREKHHIKALLEVDVTQARDTFRTIKEQGTSLSFTAWLVKCVSMAVSEYGEAHAFLKNRRAMLIFDDTDISITVEKEYRGGRVPLPYVIRSANRKSISEIHHEILAAKRESSGDSSMVIGQDYGGLAARLFLTLPGPVRRLVWRRFLLRPRTANRNMGSVMLTSIGMYGSFDGWVIPYSIHPLCFAVSTIVQKPGAVNGGVEIRDYLKMTALVDHDVMDGAPAARFLSRLNDLLTSAWGLEEIAAGTAPGGSE